MSFAASKERESLLQLNQTCDCLQLPRSEVDRSIANRASRTIAHSFAQRPHLFAATAVLVGKEDRSAMQMQIAAIEAATRLPGYREEIEQRDGHKMRSAQAETPGIFTAYDFHLTPDGPRLIEINTNAGGAFTVVEMLAAVETQMGSTCNGASIDKTKDAENRMIKMLEQEWREAGRSALPKTLAIVDEDFTGQYLYPDMLLAQSLFQRHGIDTRLVDPVQLHLREGRLWAGDWAVDLVYNRLTDFALEEPANQPLRQAWRDGSAVVSPSPKHHALFADKRNLSLLQSIDKLRKWGLPEAQLDVLQDLPCSNQVTRHSAAALWSDRKKLFFKPSAGFGGRAAYRGSKMTRKVWQAVTQGAYIAQSFVPPALRNVQQSDGSSALMKYDVRVFTCDAEPFLSAARIYQGQTTNFRSPGGGFAPVVYLGSDL